MTKRERVLTSIAHKEPDAIPIDLGSTPSSGISAIAYNELKRHLGIAEPETKVYDVVQQLAEPSDLLIDRFGVCALDIGRTFNTDPSRWYDITLADGSPAQYPTWFRPDRDADNSWRAKNKKGMEIARMPEGATFFDQTRFPYIDGYPDTFDNLPEVMDQVLWSAFVHSPWDQAGRPDFWQELRNNAIRLREQTDKALVIVAGCNLFEWGTFLRRMDNFLMDIYLEPDAVGRLLDALLEIHLETLRHVCEAVGDVADILRFGDDLGMDSGPFMAPDIYRKLFYPRHKKLCDYVHAHSSMHTFLHSCGSIADVLPHLIDAGFEIINPVQTNVRHMEPEYLKREFGKDVVFWGGGADTRHILNNGDAVQVTEHVKRNIDILGKDGGFVFAAIHNIMPDVPPENVVAMFDTVMQYGRTDRKGDNV
ncbi:MAG: uroporphyrinogen decarboxylase family protein [Sphaerochaetaceae bacterium]|nr:uroporphyrinogen decarboxylase family protein [Sphaerochaetaceae bacterium]